MTPAPKTAQPAPKPGILDIAPYVGGKSKIEGVAEPIKLSSNENALGASQAARDAYVAAAQNIFIYPEGRASRLREAVSAKMGLEQDRLIFGAGTDEIFALINQTYLEPGDNIVTGQYGFLAYRISAKANQAEIKLAPEPNYRVEVDELLKLVDERTKIVYVSNPSNPTGSWNSGEEIRRLHEGLPAHVLLVIDEAYAEYVAEPDWETALPLARNADNVVVTRTFSKIHGLAGLRIGWAYAPLSVAAAVDRIRLPFNASVPAQEAALAALSAEDHVKASKELVQQWRPRLAQAIRGFGFEVMPSAGNFVLVRFPDPKRNARAADEYLQSKGLIVRPVGGYGLTDCLRITVGTEDQNRALLDALSEFAAT
ncbi:histidinol-phosphate transaminase [Caulobacter sp. 17J65-9]|uniref:histidinol-phosphate transaminase n=1 Tax=Caulobacter sp. 17J65-9 TaxID=2709382 RepID=UPI0013C80CBF|nr:histidinol-phosphate transaminase [Caulobacter sp. 17J65-9]NEX93636.1 histidinol-phosphate transaminase [Caulobacter sp. 17J65-9]